MDRKDFKNHRVDKVPLNRSKQLMWQHIQKKAHVKQGWFQRLLHFLGLHKMALTALLTSLVIVVMVTTSLNISVIAPEVAHASFQMEALDQDVSGVSPESGFKLIASEPVSEDYIREKLVTSPPIEFEIVQLDDTQFEVKPVQELESNTIYQFSIPGQEEGEDKEFSWSYQVKDEFKILSTLPGDKTTRVPHDSGVEIQFSHEGFSLEAAQSYFEITPKVEGRFEKHQRTLAFVPQDLEEGTLYKVTVKAGLSLGDSDKVLQEDYSFQFQTEPAQDQGSYAKLRFAKNYFESKAGETVGFRIYDYRDESEQGDEVPVTIYTFKNREAYESYLEGELEQPSWVIGQAQVDLEATDVESLGTFDAIHGKLDWKDFLYVPDFSPKTGFYLMEMNDGENRVQATLQITNLSTYINMTTTQTLVWVNDVETGEPVEGAEVSLKNSGLTALTDEEGVAVFETPDAFKDAGRAGDILSVTHEGDWLINYFKPYEYVFGLIGSEDVTEKYWYHFSTDRPVYLPKDTIKYWGFLEPKNSEMVPENLRLVLTRGEQYPIQEEVIHLSQDYFFSGEMEINLLSDYGYSLSLYEGDKLISSQYLSIENYVKPAYDLELTADKNVVFAGDEIRLRAHSYFFDGTPMPNLQLTLGQEGEEDVRIKTNALGEYETTITAPYLDKKTGPCSENDYCDDRKWFRASVEPVSGEETDIYGVVGLEIFHSKITLESHTEVEDEGAQVHVKAHFVDLENQTNDYRGEVAPEVSVVAEVTEQYWEKEETGEHYDYINKKTVKEYRYIRKENKKEDLEVLTDKNGEAVIKLQTVPGRNYRLNLYAADEDGAFARDTVYVSSAEDQSGEDYYHVSTPYEYDENVFEVGQEVPAYMAKNGKKMDEKVGGQFLFMQMQGGLQSYNLQSSPSYNFKFEERDVPNVYIAGVWFDGQNYHAAGLTNIEFKKENRRLNIQVTPEKEVYTPAEDVKLSVKVTDQDGKPVSAEVNLNLIDEAYYEAVYDSFSDPLDDLYRNAPMGQLGFMITHETPFNMLSQMDGGGCFAAGTQILMADGSYKGIEDIEPGDQILTKASPSSLRMVKARVAGTVHHQVDGYWVINENLKVTPEHVVFANGQFMTVDMLRVGDSLLNKEGQWIEIKTIREVRGPVDVYNFEVENYHTYFANGFYVHNDKAGIAVRNDFEDNAYFGTIRTNVNGVGEATFQLPDNITSWRVNAKAIDAKGLQAGFEAGSIPVSLPVFGDLVFNQEYSIQDEPQIKLRAFGDSVDEGDEIEYELSSESLNFNSPSLTQTAFEPAYVALPELSLGEHDLTLTVQSEEYGDALKKSFQVVDSRLKETHLEFVPDLTSVDQLTQKTDQPLQITLLDGGRGLYYYDLMELYFTPGDRVDQRLSQWVAYDMLSRYFNQKLPEPRAFVLDNYQVAKREWPTSQSSGIRLLPYASPDLELTVLTLMADNDPDRFEVGSLKDYFYDIFKSSESNLNEVVLALVGLATLDEPVLNSLNLIRDEKELTVKDQLYLASAMAELGDRTHAEAVYDRAIALHSPSQDHAEVKALKAMVGAQLKKANVMELWKAAEQAEKEDDFLNLYQLGFLKYAMETANPTPVTFAWGKNGQSQVQTLENGKILNALLMPKDTLSLEVQSGQLAAVVYYSEPVDIEAIQSPDEDFKIERRYQVDNQLIDTLEEGQLVEVELIVYRPSTLVNTPMKVTDILPSGLTPASSRLSNSGFGSSLDYPFQINGQEVSFIWYDREISKKFTYLARVVGPGRYYADPAKLEDFDDPQWQAISEPRWIEIKRLDSEE